MPAPRRDTTAIVDDEGLVRGRRWATLRAFDAPMFNDYYWVALFDPVELADGEDGPGTEVDDAEFVDHHGRPTLQAMLTPTAAYLPCCSCCALLFSEVSGRQFRGMDDAPTHDPLDYPEAHMIRLDVQTGVCVYGEEIGGSRPGRGHDLRIEAVDDEMPDHLFPLRRSGRAVRAPRCRGW